jgi:ankyrin repeat protein
MREELRKVWKALLAWLRRLFGLEPEEPLGLAVSADDPTSSIAEILNAIEASLIDCAKAGDAPTMDLLIAVGAQVNEQDAQGMTALHHAAGLGARACVRVLVNSERCDYLIRDKVGRTAAELALEWSADRAVAVLLSKKEARQRAQTPDQED